MNFLFKKKKTYLYVLFFRLSGTPAVISDSDLKNLIDNLDEKNSSGSEIWENVVDKSRNSISYKAKCCKPKV